MAESSKMRYVIAVLLAFGLFIHIQNLSNFYTKSDLWGIRAFEYAKISSSLLSAFLVLRFHSTKMLSIVIAGSSIVNLIIPLTATSSGILFVFIGICNGIFEGMIFPYFVTNMSYWAPVKENSTLVAISLFGYLFGIVTARVISFFLSKTTFDVPFYVFGALGICWAILWLIIVKEKPLEHPKVSPSELQNIIADEKEGELITTLTRAHYKLMFWRKSTLAILFLAIVMVYSTYATGFFQLAFIIAVERDESKLAYSSIFFNLAATFSVAIVAVASDYLRRNYSITKIRKSTICFALLCSAALYVIGGTMGPQNASAYLILFGLSIIVQGILFHGCLVNALDVFYRAAGFVIGISFGLADALTLAFLMITTLIVTFTNPDDQNIFNNYYRFENREPTIWTAFTLNILACVVYAFCGSAKRENLTINAARKENILIELADVYDLVSTTSCGDTTEPRSEKILI